MKKYYIRTTHNFNNETREWEYRGCKGGDKYELWNSDEVREKTLFRKTPSYSFGVHGLESHQWMDLDWIVNNTIEDFLCDTAGNMNKFKEFMKENPDYRSVVEKDVLEELNYLISLDMVRVKEAQ